MKLEVRHHAEYGAQDPVLHQPRDEQVQPLEGMESYFQVMPESIRGQDDDGGDPTDSRNVAKNRGGARVDSGQRVSARREWPRCRPSPRRLFAAALAAKEVS